MLGVSVQFAEPADLPRSLLLGCLFFAEFGLPMELLFLLIGLVFNLIIRAEHFVGDWTPPIPLNPLVPAITLIILWLVKLGVEGVLALFFLQSVIIPRSKGIDIHHTTVSEDLVVDLGWEPLPTKSKSDMTPRCGIQQEGLAWVDAL